jgi:hypothetical protein
MDCNKVNGLDRPSQRHDCLDGRRVLLLPASLFHSFILLQISLSLARRRLVSSVSLTPPSRRPFINISYYLRTSQVSIKCSTVSARLGDISPGKFISQFKCRNKCQSYVPIFQNVVAIGGGGEGGVKKER